MNDVQWLTQDEAAEALGLSVRRLQQLRKAGVVRAERNPRTRRVRYSETEVTRVIEQRAQAWKTESGRSS